MVDEGLKADGVGSGAPENGLLTPAGRRSGEKAQVASTETKVESRAAPMPAEAEAVADVAGVAARVSGEVGIWILDRLQPDHEAEPGLEAGLDLRISRSA